MKLFSEDITVNVVVCTTISTTIIHSVTVNIICMCITLLTVVEQGGLSCSNR